MFSTVPMAGGSAADPAGALQEVQVVYGEVLANVGHFFLQDLPGLPGRQALAAQLCRPEHQHAVAEAAALGIDDADAPVREFLLQLLLGKQGRLIGAADAGGHGNIDQVLALLQHWAEMGEEQAGVQQAGGDLAAGCQLLIVSVAVEVVHVPQVFLLHPFYKIAAGQHGHALLAGCGQVGGAVREYDKRHKLPPKFRKVRRGRGKTRALRAFLFFFLYYIEGKTNRQEKSKNYGDTFRILRLYRRFPRDSTGSRGNKRGFSSSFLSGKVI